MPNNEFKYKLIAIDLDGTLLDSHNKISKENINALKLLGKKGCKFIIATGRHWRRVLEFHKDIKLPTPYVIGSNGAIVYDVKKKKIISENILNNKDVYDFVDFIKGYKYNFLIPGEKKFLASNLKEEFWDKDNLAKTRIPIELFSEENILSDDRFYKIILNFIGTPEQIQNIFSKCSDAFSDRFEFFHTKSDTGALYIEANSLNVSKGNALKLVANNSKLDLSQIISIGDSGNDISMLKITGLSFAPVNATDPAKNAAKVVLPQTNDEHLIKAVYDYFELNNN